MPRVLFYLGAVAIWIPLAGAQPATRPEEPYSPASLAAELRGLQSALDHGSDPQSLVFPAAWQVETSERHFSISTEPLRTLLETIRKDPSRRESGIRQAQAWLDMLAQQLEGFETPAPAPPAASRAKLDKILAHPEFVVAVRPPTPLEVLRQRIIAWFQELLRRIFGAMAEHATTSEILFWIVVAACVGFLAVWLIRWWTRDRRIPGLPRPPSAETPVRTEQEWLAAAHRAAQEGDWRQAIHNAYWAAVSRLQRCGALPEDLTRTPREYLRLFAGRPAPDPSREPLAALTSGLERFWYARRTARLEDFRESLIHLETLGCKVE
jgi:hypothetical protein